MITHEQRQYLEDVLGIQSAGFILASEVAHVAENSAAESVQTTSPVAEVEHHQILVLTAPLTSEERDLLSKILGSIKLKNYHHVEQAQISLAELPPQLSARNVLAFAEYPTGKSEFDQQVWWVLPPVALMIGANAEVVSRKKEAWSLLQQFSRENT